MGHLWLGLDLSPNAAFIAHKREVLRTKSRYHANNMPVVEVATREPGKPAPQERGNEPQSARRRTGLKDSEARAEELASLQMENATIDARQHPIGILPMALPRRSFTR
jgi:hypothetical protein